LNHRHRDFQSRALPTELPGRRPRNEGSRGAGRYRGWVGPCPATDWAPARPCLRRPSVRLVIARTGLAHLIIVLLRRRNRVPAAQPAMQVDIGAAPRAERAKLLDVRLAADRAGLRGLRGRIQWVGLSCGNRQPRCRRPVGWHLWRLHDGCICLHDGRNGIYGVCATDATPLCDGIYGRRWYLRRLHHVAASLCDGMWAFSPSNAISRRDGIYGLKWHLWRLHRVATSLCDGIYGVTWHLCWDMASMA
jgi:hypothetical protein